MFSTTVATLQPVVPVASPPSARTETGPLPLLLPARGHKGLSFIPCFAGLAPLLASRCCCARALGPTRAHHRVARVPPTFAAMPLLHAILAPSSRSSPLRFQKVPLLVIQMREFPFRFQIRISNMTFFLSEFEGSYLLDRAPRSVWAHRSGGGSAQHGTAGFTASPRSLHGPSPLRAQSRDTDTGAGAGTPLASLAGQRFDRCSGGASQANRTRRRHARWRSPRLC